MQRDFIQSDLFWFFLVVITSLAAVLAAVISLAHGFNELFPYFFLAPLLIVVYASPKRGVFFAVGMGSVYIGIVYLFGTLTVDALAAHTAWFYIYVSLGVLLTSIVTSLRNDREELDRLKREAFLQIEQNMEQFAILNDQIRNPLQAIMLDTETLDEESQKLIRQQVQIIEKIVDTLDEKSLESEKIREFLRKYYGFN